MLHRKPLQDTQEKEKKKANPVNEKKTLVPVLKKRRNEKTTNAATP